ncbi:hypothetical protein H9X96_02365 [Pedobacter sp. N36a]|uniref:hypothetical protein n=1 Tax=Pedobacter sp. N36a TaxID=2767996 RepID=UPI0016569EFD|nr:hypothetical protein [Pedobacter sp. N36a]MBC8984614.1 hypothetical protein [Pedobacter sp. N36a]
MIRLTIILSLCTLSVIAQPVKRALSLNLDFENVADVNYSPASWIKYGEGHSVKIDFSEKYGGSSSLLIKSKDNRLEKDSMALVLNRIESLFKGDIVELSGYLKLDHVEGRSGLVLVINGKNGPLVAEEMKDVNLNGTNSWKKYSIRLKLPDSVVSIDFGLYQIGKGRLWADNLKLLIDNQDISLPMAILKDSNVSTVKQGVISSGDFSSKFGKIITSDFLLNDSLSRVSGVPAVFKFDKFYEKYLNAAGLPIIGSKAVSDEAFYKTREVILMMLEKCPSIKAKLIDNNARIAILGKNELTIDIPEYSGMDEQMNTRARGFGGTTELPLTSCGEENILCLNNDRYNGEDILIHEFAHAMHSMGISFIDIDFNNKLNTIYSQALSEGLWKDTYAISNPAEYFAEGVQSWFKVNKKEAVTNGIHNDINTRDKLKLYDPRLHDLISMYFAVDKKNVSCHCHQQKDNNNYWMPWYKEK